MFLLLFTRKVRRKIWILSPLYKWLLKRYRSASGPVKARLHGFDVIVNPGNTYPFLIQDEPLFNAPLVELVHQTWRAKGKPVRMIDIGAACGDSVLLIKSKCPGQVSEFLCIEGDEEFFGILSQNMAQFSDVRIEKALLSDMPVRIRSLVKHHQGSATAKGDHFVQAVTLDSLSEKLGGPFDILKIDVDGFDGKVIGGARHLLETQKPAVIFEWHPKLIEGCGTELTQAFDVLQSCGYSRFLWFCNHGKFSHFTGQLSSEVLKKASDYLLRVNSRSDEHFDIIALHDTFCIDEIELAATELFQKKKKRWNLW